MAYRNLFISNKATIRTEKEQLLIVTDKLNKVPIEDINSIVIENIQSFISIYTLMKLAEKNTTVYICDQKHLPCALLLPYSQNSRYLEVIRVQESLSEVQKKQLWRKIILAKIRNQAKCLQIMSKENEAQILYKLSQRTLSGDKSNTEATAANVYFKALFDKSFNRRDDEDARNGLLNYGYAIIRGQIARLIAGYGFLAMKGIHHKNVQNPYNLVDDFIEPFRPIVDLFVAGQPIEIELNSDLKHQLYNLLNADILIQQKHYSVAYAAELMIQSFTRFCFDKSNDLALPELVPLRMHRYE